MRIANPMYDAVFKHLLEDEISAKLIVGSILGQPIEHLELVPTEAVVVAARDQQPGGYTVQRIDFAATVVAGGQRMRVLIEVQKSHYSDDVLRFRRYLGQNYAGSVAVVSTDDGKQALPLRMTTIYFLGRKLPRTDATVLKVVRQYVDAVTGAQLAEREDFVEHLSHDCYVVQVPLLTERRRNDLEKLLAVFDQSRRVADDGRVLEVAESEMPTAYAPVLRRLERAASDPRMAELMLFEDEVNSAWRRMRDAIAERDATVAEQEQVLAERDATVAEQKNALAERDAALAERDEALARQQAEIEALRRRLGE